MRNLILFEDCQSTSAELSWNLSEYSWNDDDQIQYRIILGRIKTVQE